MIEPFSFRELKPEDTFLFRCSRCGECCHNVKNAIILSSMDIFKIARFMNRQVEDIVENLTELVILDETVQFPILMAKVRQHGDACFFYKTGRCTIQEAKPFTCRMYPLSVTPELNCGIVSQKPHHFTGDEHRGCDWMDENMSPDDRRFIVEWYGTAHELGQLIRQAINRKCGNKAPESVVERVLWYLYIAYDVDSEFWPQYERNMGLLKQELKNFARG